MYEILYDYGVVASDPRELYTELFRLGEGYIQRTGEYRKPGSKNFKGNPMIYVNDGEKFSGQMKRYILLEDTLLDQLEKASKMPSNLINPVSYFGLKKDKEHSDKCFGLIVDIDDIDEGKMHNFIHGCYNDIYPCPNYIVISKSGKGMHLYYMFDEPLRLFPKTKIQLKSVKYDLINLLWNFYTSNNKNVQLQSYDQSFMVAGTKPNMKVYKTNFDRWNIKDLANWVGFQFEEEELWIESKMTLEEAKKKYPKWYEKVILNNDKSKGHWTCKRDLYDWWLAKIKDPASGATYGRRYWCTMMLVIYAVKSGISYEEVEKDAYDLIPFMNALNPKEPFTKSDVKSALDCYDVQFATFPIKDISKLSGIEIIRNKRNGQKQADHLEEARAIRDIRMKRQGKKWTDGNGRKSKQEVVQQWQKSNPNGKKIDCSRETGLHINTVYKWWFDIPHNYDKESIKK